MATKKRARMKKAKRTIKPQSAKHAAPAAMAAPARKATVNPRGNTGHIAPTDRYLELVRAFPLRPIASDQQLNHAVPMLDKLMDQTPRSRDEEDYVLVLAGLIEAYETANLPEPDIAPDAMLRDLIEERGLTKKALAEAAGLGLSTLSEIAAGKRPMTRAHIEKLAKALGVHPAVFLN